MAENNNHGESRGAWREPAFGEFDDEFDTLDRDSDFAAIISDENDDPAADDSTAEREIWDFIEDDPLADEDTAARTPNEAAEMTLEEEEDEESWLEPDEEEHARSEESGEMNLSLGMIAIAATALILLAVGGYGIIEQRASLREEVRQLQAELATAASPAEVSAVRTAAENAESRNSKLEADLLQLTRENRSLQAIVKGLEAQLETQQQALKPSTPTPAPAKAAAPAPAKRAAQPARVAPPESKPASGDWFVNFSSYTRRETAERWVGQLKPEQGRAIVTSGESDGKTVYRVRIVDLQDSASANSLARTLEKEYGLSRLWVGKQ